MGKRYGISISAGDEKVTLVFSQLTFRDRNRITQASTSYKGGKVVLDMGLSCFYTLKYGLKEIKGFQNDKGEPYKLEFEKGTPELTDKCVDEILSCNISDQIIYAARELGAEIPDKILHPLTNQPLEGVEIIPPEKLRGSLEKK
jgi:hypothetical protein